MSLGLLLFNIELPEPQTVQTKGRRIVIVVFPNPNFLSMRGKGSPTKGFPVGNAAPVGFLIRFVFHAKQVVPYDQLWLSKTDFKVYQF